MAYIPNQDQDTKDEDEGVLAGQQGPGITSNPAEQGANGPVSLSQGGGTIQGATTSSSAAPAAAASSPGGPKGSGSFTNISQYLKQNQPQSAELANKVATNISNKGNQVRSNIDQGFNTFNTQVQENTVKQDQGLLDEAKTNAAQVAADKAKADQFIRMRQGQYTGPETLESQSFFKPITQELESAKQYGSNIESDQGRKALIGDVQKNKNVFKSGVSSLNNLLLQNDENARGILKDARGGLGDLDSKLGDAGTRARDAVTQARADSLKTKDAVQNQFLGEGGVVNQFKQDLDSRTNQAIEKARAEGEQFRNLLATGGSGAELPEEILAKSGMDRSQYQSVLDNRNALRGMRFGNDSWNDLSRYATINKPEDQINRANFANADEYAKFNALNSLLGTEDKFLGPDASQAGTANLDTIDFNYNDVISGLMSNVQRAKQTEIDRGY
jgi:hypothetical protein